MGIIRILFFIGILAILYYIIRQIFTPSAYKKCGRCNGKGYWYVARGKETCDVCKGSGRMPKA